MLDLGYWDVPRSSNNVCLLDFKCNTIICFDICFFLCRFRQEQESILRKKEEERRAQLAEKAKTRESYREKMSNVMKIDVSCL